MNIEQNLIRNKVEIRTKKVWVKLIYVINYIVTFGASVAVLEAVADTLETAGQNILNNTRQTEQKQ